MKSQALALISLILLSYFLLSSDGSASPLQKAGAIWTGGGGETESVAHNPWFLGARDDVFYCVVADGNRISVQSHEALNNAISRAIAYWAREFSHENIGWNPLRFDAVQFKKSASCENAALTFYFGSLPATENVRLQAAGVALDKYVALSFQTAYDLKALKGKGFIYVAADQGEDLVVPSGVWSSSTRLEKVLSHEMGHVFGIQHQTGGLMATEYPEQVVQERLEESRDPPPFFNARQRRVTCTSLAPETLFILRAFFANEAFCSSGFVSIDLSSVAHNSDTGGDDQDFSGADISWWQLDSSGNKWLQHPIGQIDFSGSERREVIAYPVKLFLPEQQDAFLGFSHDMLRIALNRRVWQGLLMTQTKGMHRVVLIAEPNSLALRLSASYRDVPYYDIFQGY